MSRSLKQLDEDVKTLEADMTHAKWVDTQQAKMLNEANRKLDSLHVEVVEVGHDIAAMNVRMKRGFDDLRKEIRQVNDPIRDDVSDLKTGFSELKSGVSSLSGDVSTLKTDMSSLKTDVSGLKTEMSEVRSDISDIRSEISGIRADVQILTETVSRLVQKLDDE